MAFDIYTLIFDLLGVAPTGDFQADFLKLIFFPHVVILIWLYLIARGPVFRAMHRGIGILLSLSIYIFIIYYGWYASIASLAMFWFGATIVISLFYFMIPKLIHPGATGSRFGLGKSVADMQLKGKSKRKLGDTIDNLKDDLRIIQRQIRTAPERTQTEIDYKVRLKAEEFELKNEIRRLERDL